MLERHFISLGAGVQSTAMLLLAEEGEITPKPEAAIFSDTQWEPQSVYNTLDWLDEAVSIPIHRVTAGNLRENSLKGVASSGHRASDGSGFQSMPLFTDGSRMSRRTCTFEYKIKPLERKVRELCGVGYGKRFPVKEQKIVQWVGISWDELTRMRIDPRAYAELRYPLVDMQWTRSKCLTFLQNRYPGMPPPENQHASHVHTTTEKDGPGSRQTPNYGQTRSTLTKRSDTWAGSFLTSTALANHLQRSTLRTLTRTRYLS